MKTAAKSRVLARIRARKPISRKKFCGHSKEIVECPPGECHQVKGICPKSLSAVIEAHRPILEALHNHASQKSQRTGVKVNSIALEDYGELVGLLVCLLGNKQAHSHA